MKAPQQGTKKEMIWPLVIIGAVVGTAAVISGSLSVVDGPIRVLGFSLGIGLTLGFAGTLVGGREAGIAVGLFGGLTEALAIALDVQFHWVLIAGWTGGIICGVMWGVAAGLVGGPRPLIRPRSEGLSRHLPRGCVGGFVVGLAANLGLGMLWGFGLNPLSGLFFGLVHGIPSALGGTVGGAGGVILGGWLGRRIGLSGPEAELVHSGASPSRRMQISGLTVRSSSVKIGLSVLLVAVGAWYLAWLRLEPQQAYYTRDLPGSVRSLALAPDGQTLATATTDGTIRVWSLPRGEVRATFKGSCVAFSPDGRVLASATKGTVTLRDLVNGEERTLRGPPELILSQAFAPDGRTLVAGTASGTVNVWDVSTTHILATLQAYTRNADVRSVAFAPHGQTFATASSLESVLLWDVTTREPRGTLPPSGSRDQGMLSRREGGATETADERLERAPQGVDGPKGAPRDKVDALAFSSDGRTLAAGTQEGKTKLWDVVTGREQATLGGHTGTVSAVAFSADGQTVWTGGQDRRVREWDVRTATMRRNVKGHRGPVMAILITPDGQTVVTGSLDGTVKLWDRSSWRLRTTLQQ